MLMVIMIMFMAIFLLMIRNIIKIFKLTSNNIQKIIEIGNKMLEIQREIIENQKKILEEMNWEDNYVKAVSEAYKKLDILRSEDWSKDGGSTLPS